MQGSENYWVVLVAKLSASVDDLVFVSASATFPDPMQGIHALMGVVKRFDGELLGAAGDGVLARFRSAEDAVDAAAVVAHQCEVNDSQAAMGLCSGQPGDSKLVSHAGAMLKQASSGQIVVCDTTVKILGNLNYPAGVVAVSTRQGGRSPGFIVRPSAEHVRGLIGDNHDDAQVEVIARPNNDAWVVIEHAGSRRLVTERDDPISVGRSPRCHVHVKDNFVSRRHCTIRVNGGRALLADTSSGGCWIWQPRRDITSLRNKEIRLPEGGVIYLGYRPTRERQPQRISFVVGGEASRRANNNTNAGGRQHRHLLRSRSDQRMPLREFEARMDLPDGATQLPVELVDLGAGGVGIIADCPLGTVSDVMQLVLDKGGASIRCELRHVGRRRSGRTLERWLHGAAFLDVDEKARTTVLERLDKLRATG